MLVKMTIIMDTMRNMLSTLRLPVTSVKEMMLILALELLLLLGRNVLTRWRWLKRLSMMMLCSVITPMTRGATLLTSQTMSLSRRRSARRTTGKTVSLNMRRLLLMKLLLFAEPLLSRTVTFRDLKYVELSMNPSAGLNKRFMMLRMMLLTARLKLRRSVKMKLQDTPPTPSAPSGPRKSALYPRSTLPSPDVPRSQGRSVLQLVVDSRKVPRSVLTKPKLLSRMLLRNSVLLSPNVPASM